MAGHGFVQWVKIKDDNNLFKSHACTHIQVYSIEGGHHLQFGLWPFFGKVLVWHGSNSICAYPLVADHELVAFMVYYFAYIYTYRIIAMRIWYYQYIMSYNYTDLCMQNMCLTFIFHQWSVTIPPQLSNDQLFLTAKGHVAWMEMTSMKWCPIAENYIDVEFSWNRGTSKSFMFIIFPVWTIHLGVSLF